ncbi:MAG: hypothetical protein ACP5LH_02270 [Candidatus Micrarchaeia archaeon]
MKKKNYDLDSLIKEQEERESRMSQVYNTSYSEPAKKFIGIIEKYFSKLGVVAIKLEDSVSIGDIIEIGNEEEAIRQKITSMQINRKNVTSANKGDSIGITIKYPVQEGAKVYKYIRY